MASDSERENFSDLVSEAESTLEHLNRLTTEIQNYKASSDNLNAATDGLTHLSNGMSEVAEELRQAGITLREIGTEAIMRKLGSLRVLLSWTLTVAVVSVVLSIIAVVMVTRPF